LGLQQALSCRWLYLFDTGMDAAAKPALRFQFHQKDLMRQLGCDHQCNPECTIARVLLQAAT
jgi:hypothetical protein